MWIDKGFAFMPGFESLSRQVNDKTKCHRTSTNDPTTCFWLGLELVQVKLERYFWLRMVKLKLCFLLTQPKHTAQLVLPYFLPNS